MDIQQLLERQVLVTPKRIQRNFTYIIKKNHLQLEQQSISEKVPTMPSIRIQLRSKSQNKKASKHTKTIKEYSLQAYDAPLPNKIEPVKMRNIRTQRNSPKRKYKSLEKKIESLTPEPSRQLMVKKQNIYQNYMQHIRAQPDLQYKPLINFQHLRRRGRRDGIIQNEKKLIQTIMSTFTDLYDNLSVFTEKSKRIISQKCRNYLQTYQKAKLQIILSIYYPKLLHTKLRPYLVFKRQIIYYIYILNVSSVLEKLSLSQIDSIKLSVKYIKQCLQILIEPILQMQEQVVSRINQTFRILKAIGQVQKKLAVIERQMRRMFIKSNKTLLKIELAFSYLITDKQQWHLQKLYQKQMEISWKYLQIPPFPYLPEKKQNKKYTVIIQLDQTIIYYDQAHKTLKYRPYIDIFLNKLRESFQLVVFTTSSLKYAQIMVSQIEKVGKYFDYILSESHLTIHQGTSIKDFSKLGRDLKRVVIVDHVKPLIKKYGVNYVEITPWQGDKSDRCLYKLSGVLSQMSDKDVEDVRHYFWQNNSSLEMIDQNEEESFQKKGGQTLK